MSEMSCPPMNNWKLRCCIARKRVVRLARKPAEKAGLGGVDKDEMTFLHSFRCEKSNLATMQRTNEDCQLDAKKVGRRFGRILLFSETKNQELTTEDCYSFGGSGAPTCMWLRSRSMALSS